MSVRFGWQRDLLREGDGGAGGGGGAAKPWYDGKVTDAEMIGHLQNRGWHDKPIDVVAIEAVTAHREAQKLLGVPAAQLLRLPTDPKDEPGWNAVWSKLGAPAEAKDYDFSTVKQGDKPLDAAFEATLRATAAQLHLPKDSATAIAAALVKHNEGVATASLADKTAALAAEKTALDTNWGANKEANMVIAKGAAKALGVDEATIAALEGAIGYAKTMEMFRSIGTKIGEDKFVRADGGGNGIMSRDQAVARKAELMKDNAWVKRYLDGGTPENREMQSLIALIGVPEGS